MIHNTEKKDNFTMLHNKTINDKALGIDALGLLTILLAKPGNWKVSIAALTAERKIGKHRIRKALNELCKAGYATTKPSPFGGWDWQIYDKKQSIIIENNKLKKTKKSNQKTEIPKSENQTSENPEIQKSEFRKLDFVGKSKNQTSETTPIDSVANRYEAEPMPNSKFQISAKNAEV